MSTELTINHLFPAKRKKSPENEAYTCVGIDFGTSTSVVSIASVNENGKSIHCEAIPIKQRQKDFVHSTSTIIPTVLALYKSKLLVGSGAKTLKYEYQKGKDMWYSFKMELGEDAGYNYPESVLNKDQQLTILTANDAAFYFFMFLKGAIEEYVKKNNLSKDIRYTISIPASFEANQRKDLLKALERNKIKLPLQALIDEPNAAFLSYTQSCNVGNRPICIPDNYNPILLVFDFGAGTCDISILEIGKSYDGIEISNKSISRFEKLGGDDIDRSICQDIFYPKFLKENKLKKNTFTEREKTNILNCFMQYAERLKELACSNLAVLTENFELPKVAHSKERKENINQKVLIETTKGKFFFNDVSISNYELTSIYNDFCKIQTTEHSSIFRPIKSALKKANLSKDDIDYVLLIGGSSKAPYIQSAINQFFSKSDLLIPQNLQTHVSAGAAIHSLIFNKFNKSIIKPITSERIFLIAQNQESSTLIKAGTQIPFGPIINDQFIVNKKNQEQIELPICVGNEDKVLTNIVIKPKNSNVFELGTTVKLILNIDYNKVIKIEAYVDNTLCETELLNPFKNKALTISEKEIVKAERETNIATTNNDGEPTVVSLKILAETYEKHELYLKAAETYERIKEIKPSAVNLNNIGVLYANAGDKDKAIDFYRQAIQNSPSSTTHLNIAYEYKSVDSDKYLEHLNLALELDKKNAGAQYELGIYEKQKKGNARHIQIAFDLWEEKLLKKELKDWDKNKFISAAKMLKEEMIIPQINAYYEKDELVGSNSLYNDSNLIGIKNKELK